MTGNRYTVVLPTSYQTGDAGSLTNVNDRSVACLTAAQAAHWFDIESFYQEAKRVVKPGGIVAIWTHGNMRISQQKQQDKRAQALEQKIMTEFYQHTLADRWDDRRSLVET